MTALSSPAQPGPAGSPGGAGSPILVKVGSTLLRRKAWIAGLWVAIFAGGVLLVGSTLGATKPSVFASGRESFDERARPRHLRQRRHQRADRPRRHTSEGKDG
jgi:hypothetical protein